MSTATLFIPSIHNLRQTQASLQPARHDKWSEKRSRERDCGGAMERARFNVRLLRLTTGPRQS